MASTNSKMTNKQAKAALDKFKYEVANDVGVKKIFEIITHPKSFYF